MKVNLINGNIYHLIGDNAYELGSTFIRMEEFYESPFEDIRGKWFSLDYYMDLYAASKNGNFSYFDDWGGFNIPGNSLLDFFDKFEDDLRTKEHNVKQIIEKHILDNDPNFYVIGSTPSADILEHEYAHAKYYLNPEYRGACDYIYEDMPALVKSQISGKLLAMGYDQTKVEDETHAYLATATISDLIDYLGFQEDNLPIKTIRAYQDNLEPLLPIIQTTLFK